MRERHVCRAWARRFWLPLIVVVCGGFLPLLFVLGQAARELPAREPGLYAQFGPVRAVDDKAASPETDRSQQPDKDGKKKKPGVGDKDGGVLLYAMPVTPPSPDQLFRLDSEERFRERLRAEVRQRAPKVRLEFPDAEPPVSVRPPAPTWPAYVKWVEPSYVVSRRLLFEQPRFERYGESLGVLQPAVFTGIFGFDLLLWPARRLAHPFRCYQVNTDCYSPYFQMVGD